MGLEKVHRVQDLGRDLEDVAAVDLAMLRQPTKEQKYSYLPVRFILISWTTKGVTSCWSRIIVARDVAG